MNLSKIDLLNKRFSRSPLGYAPREVDQFLVEVAEALGEAADRHRELGRKAKRLEARLQEYRQRDETLRDTLMSTQKMVDELKVAAGREAEIVLQEANSKARSIVQRGHERLAQLHDEIEALKRQRNQFRIQVKGLVQAHLELLEGRDPEQDRLEDLESRVSFLKKAE
ncbi:cell division initiation protein [Paucidesulfovibrio gracilis DSM 16080]|uniref:Cell division initiation protein n=1 Tax=Paucidesulfovibrio gracilis DSM 16080 TaxID=1121449 RepID=A0A1T4WST6_9BACT|nr:DivIVA domain-containing protein [Paucidesulfovibrio gracilis]SKA80433.1 cell division initiation protein [Paucidesulfovibrio gracilis DSM 16080]